MEKNTKPMLDVLRGKAPSRVPFWLMRQAGRYLPEYRALRADAGGFLDLVYDSGKAAEVTVQPLRRFGMDAAILFSDILVVPHALGQDVRFEAGEGPRLTPVTANDFDTVLNIETIDARLSAVYETVAKTRGMMNDEGFEDRVLIGFCGSPWTVICYMVEGRGSRDFEAARRFALQDPDAFQRLVDLVTDASCRYLSGQIAAGAEVVQLFESWGGILDHAQFERWIIRPTAKIRSYLRTHHPDVPVIGFPRGSGAMSVDYTKKTGVDAVGLDTTVPPAWARDNLQPLTVVQGNLDPVRLLSGGKALEEGMKDIHAAFKDRPFIFNLGHGVIKETDPDNVALLAAIVRSWPVPSYGETE